MLGFACRLIRKAYQQNLNTLVYAPGQAEALDDLLWTFADQEFIPHTLINGASTADDPTSNPIRISSALKPATDSAMLIALDDVDTQAANAFDRVALVVSNDEDKKGLARQRYSEWKQLGLTPETHVISR